MIYKKTGQWYIEWQRVTTIGAVKRVTKSDSK